MMLATGFNLQMQAIKCCTFYMKPGYIGKFLLAVQLKLILVPVSGEMSCCYEHSWCSARHALLTFMKD